MNIPLCNFSGCSHYLAHRHLKPPPVTTMKWGSISAMATQKTHSMPAEKIEVFKSLEPWASEHLVSLVKPVEKCWQPHNLLPDSSMSLDEFTEEVKILRERTWKLPEDYLVVLVGDMITEEALPTYQTWINKFDGVGDETGSSPTPWAIWTRSWTAEENRHGDLLRT
ncbi:hypothetical protein VNO77_36654 [Canavalia gladiata]|uniref:Uncharacterized protein n=1 Tax=Canavalia gladiata TaxID=3824 RepID=A0AAN9K868_CANGL